MKRVLGTAALALTLLGLTACGGTDRPEGVVERWLISLNQGAAGEPGKYASPELSSRILPHWETRDPGDLDVIEVGHGRPASREGIVLGDYDVPFKVGRISGVKIEGVAKLLHREGEWRILEIDINPSTLRVPSDGGDPIAGASGAAWLVALAISAVLMLLVALAMRFTPDPIPLPTRRD